MRHRHRDANHFGKDREELIDPPHAQHRTHDLDQLPRAHLPPHPLPGRDDVGLRAGENEGPIGPRAGGLDGHMGPRASEHAGPVRPRAGEHEDHIGPRAGEHEDHTGPRAGEHEGHMGPKTGGLYM